jgi:hypothetical protein
MHITTTAYIEGAIDNTFVKDLDNNDIDYTYKELDGDKEILVEVSVKVLAKLYKILAISIDDYTQLRDGRVGEIVFY